VGFEAVAAITLTTSIIEVVQKQVEADDAAVIEILKKHGEEAKRFRDEQESKPE
jgi:hypothetical protein